MSFIDRVKKGAEQAAEQVKAEVEDLKTKNEIVRTYEDLGRKTFELMDKGELANPNLQSYVDHLRDLRAKLEAAAQPDWKKDEPQPPGETSS
jgi:type I site-specific restriction endonuclease